MKLTSIPMFASSLRLGVAGLLLFGLGAPQKAAAADDAIHDPHRVFSNEDFQQTIEARCTICHTRERIEQALGEGKDLDALLQRMIERGAVLSERDKKVLGTFWGSPLSGDRQPESLPPQN